MYLTQLRPLSISVASGRNGSVIGSTFTKRVATRRLSSRAPSVHLYQYAICPFCRKTKALMDYCNIEYRATEVNPLTKSELKPWSGDYRKVPIAMIEDKQVNGSDAIVSALLQHPNVISSLEQKWSEGMDMNEFFHADSTKKWMEFATNDLASLLYPNICRTLGDSFQAFSYVANVDAFSPIQKASIRGLGSIAMYFAASKIKTKKGISDERQALNDVLNKWEGEGLSQGKSLFSSRKKEPSMGDIAVYGALRSVEGLPAHAEIIEGRGGAIQAWYNGMKEKVDTME